MATIFWAADSTVQYNSFATYPQTGMGQVLPLFLKPEIKIENHAKNGRSTKSFLSDGRHLPICERISEGDFLFIEFGHNDEKVDDETRFTEPDGEYTENLIRFVQMAREKNAYPVLISPLTRRSFEDGVLVEGKWPHTPYVNAMRKVAEKHNVPMIPLYEMSREAVIAAGEEETESWYMHIPAGKYYYHPEGLSDNTHLQYKGAVIFTRLIARGLYELGGIYRDLLLDDVQDKLS